VTFPQGPHVGHTRLRGPSAGSSSLHRAEGVSQPAPQPELPAALDQDAPAARGFDKLGHDVLMLVVLQMNARKMSEVLAAIDQPPVKKP
jgi:hypothetical protein